MIKKIISIILLIIGLSSCSQKEHFYNKKDILALGDSLTIGYGLDINDSYPMQLEKILKDNGYDYTITNAGISGNTSENLLNRIKNYDDTKYGIYLLNIGSNDALRRLSLENMRNNIEEIINHIKKVNPESNIILIGNKVPINLGLSYSSNFYSSFEDIANKNDLYYYDFLLKGVYMDVNLNLNDNMHPNKQGYEIISNNIFQFLKDKNIINK